MTSFTNCFHWVRASNTAPASFQWPIASKSSHYPRVLHRAGVHEVGSAHCPRQRRPPPIRHLVVEKLLVRARAHTLTPRRPLPRRNRAPAITCCSRGEMYPYSSCITLCSSIFYFSSVYFSFAARDPAVLSLPTIERTLRYPYYSITRCCCSRPLYAPPLQTL